MNIAIVGTGYVGLVTGTCFAETGNQVTCVDIDANKINKLKNGELTIFEPDLDILYERNLKQGRLHFTTRLEEVIEKSKIIFLALPTPDGGDGQADLKYVVEVAGQLGKLIDQYVVIVNKSTVPVGTADLVRATIRENYPGEFDVVSNPEFLREGVAVDDFMKPDRVVIGSSSERARKMMEQLYEPFIRQGNPLYFMDERSAEMTKYAANSFLATKISFMNEMANLCELTGADIDKVRLGIGSDNRIGKRFLFAGIGYGGSCFPKDVKALVKMADHHHYDFRILQAVIEVNQRQKKVLVEKIRKHFGGKLAGKTIAVWGLSFKPDTDDIRDAPSLEIIPALMAEGMHIRAYDPVAMENARRVLSKEVSYCNDLYACLDGADALAILTEWSEFRNPDFEEVSKRMPSKLIFDGRNLYKMESLKELGFTYHSIGRS